MLNPNQYCCLTLLTISQAIRNTRLCKLHKVSRGGGGLGRGDLRLTHYSADYAFWVTWSERVLDTSPKCINPEGLGRHHTGTTQVSPYHLITCATNCTVGPHGVKYFSNDFHLTDFLFCSPYKPTIIEHLLNLSTPARSLQTNIFYIIFIQIQITTAALLL